MIEKLYKELISTDSRHYCNYLKPLRQLAIKTAIDRWTISLCGGKKAVDEEVQVRSMCRKEQITFYGRNVPTENYLEIQTPYSGPEKYLKLTIEARFGANIIVEEIKEIKEV